MNTPTRLRQGTRGDSVIAHSIKYEYSYEEYVECWKRARELFDMEEPVVREVYNRFYNEISQNNKWK
jgi:hypothetical protein